MDIQEQEERKSYLPYLPLEVTLKEEPGLLPDHASLPTPFSSESFEFFLNYMRLWRLFPEVSRNSLHTLLCGCSGSLARAVDNVHRAQRIRQYVWRRAEAAERGRLGVAGVKALDTPLPAPAIEHPPKIASDSPRWSSLSMSGGSLLNSSSGSSGEHFSSPTSEIGQSISSSKASPASTTKPNNELDQLLGVRARMQPIAATHSGFFAPTSPSPSNSSSSSGSFILPPNGTVEDYQRHSSRRPDETARFNPRYEEDPPPRNDTWLDYIGFKTDQEAFLDEVKNMDHDYFNRIVELSEIEETIKNESTSWKMCEQEENSPGAIFIDLTEEHKTITIL